MTKKLRFSRNSRIFQEIWRLSEDFLQSQNFLKISQVLKKMSSFLKKSQNLLKISTFPQNLKIFEFFENPKNFPTLDTSTKSMYEIPVLDDLIKWVKNLDDFFEILGAKNLISSEKIVIEMKEAYAKSRAQELFAIINDYPDSLAGMA